MNKKLLIPIVLFTLLISSVSAECSDYEINQFSQCYGSRIFTETWFWLDCWQYDYNTLDGVINLSDLVYFAQSCYEEPLISENKRPILTK